jgi:hypothetical protein
VPGWDAIVPEARARQLVELGGVLGQDIESTRHTDIGENRREVFRRGLPEVGFYYPDPMWMHGDWVENLVLFFDGIALLVPDYMEDRLEHFDPAIVTGLRDQGLLHVIKPEEAVDKSSS